MSSRTNRRRRIHHQLSCLEMPSWRKRGSIWQKCVASKMTISTRVAMMDLVYCAAGCGMFNSLDIEDLTTGKDPIVSRDVLTILTKELLRRTQMIFSRV